MSTPYAERVSRSFQAAKPERFGDGHATVSEMSALRSIFKINGGNRSATIKDIRTYAYPRLENITPEDVALAGASHACAVTEDLAVTRGPEGKDSTYESYTIKTRFDRFTLLHLPVEVRENWQTPIERQNDFVNEGVSYPYGVDETLIHGGALPHRFLPAQTMRYLELARLRKLDEASKDTLLITDDTDLTKYGLVWDSLVPTIANAVNPIQLAGSIGAKIAQLLLENGLSQTQVEALLNKTYSTIGIASEHGHIPEATAVRDALSSALQDSEETKDLKLKREHRRCPADVKGVIASMEEAMYSKPALNHSGTPAEVASKLIDSGLVDSLQEFEEWLRENDSRVHFVAVPLDHFGETWSQSTKYIEPTRVKEDPQYTLWIGINGAAESAALLRELGATPKENLRKLGSTGMLSV